MVNNINLTNKFLFNYNLSNLFFSITTNEAINEYRRRIFKLKSTLGLDASESYDEYLEIIRAEKLSEREQLLGTKLIYDLI